MNTLRQFRLELTRLLQNRLTWLAILLTALSPVAGLTVYRPLYSSSDSGYVTTMQGDVSCKSGPGWRYFGGLSYLRFSLSGAWTGSGGTAWKP